jgi:hypothetical protein
MLRRLALALAYILGAVIIIGGTIVLVQIGRGYSYDFRTNRFVLNGLLVISSQPGSASITLGERVLNRRTPYRTTIEAAEYDLKISKPGYRDWSKRISVQPTQVTWVQYPILLPDKIEAERFITSGSVKFLVPNRDHKRFAYITEGEGSGLWVTGLDRQPTRIYTPVELPDRPPETLLSAEWSDDSSHLLVQSRVGEAVKYLVVASEPAPAINLTDLFRFEFNQLKFSPRDWRQLYWISPEGLRRIDLEAQTASAVLADRVKNYTFADDRLLLIQTTDIGQSVVGLDSRGNKQELIASIPDSPAYNMAYTKHRDRDYLAIIPSLTSTLTLYGDVFSANPISKQISKNADRAFFNGDGRYLAFATDNSYGTYDLDADQIDAGKLETKLVSLIWYDNFHLLMNSGGKAVLVEYDGENPGTIIEDIGSMPAYSSNDGRHVLSVRPIDGLQQLVVAEIRK